MAEEAERIRREEAKVEQRRNPEIMQLQKEVEKAEQAAAQRAVAVTTAGSGGGDGKYTWAQEP